MLGMRFSSKIKLRGFLFILPVFLYFCILYWYPLLQTFSISLQEVLPGMKMVFVGLKTYGVVFSDELFWESLWNTLNFSLQAVVLTISAGLLVSIALNNLKSSKLRNFLTLFYILPTLCFSRRRRIHLGMALSATFWIYKSGLRLFGFTGIEVFIRSIAGHPKPSYHQCMGSTWFLNSHLSRRFAKHTQHLFQRCKSRWIEWFKFFLEHYPSFALTTDSGFNSTENNFQLKGL